MSIVYRVAVWYPFEGYGGPHDHPTLEAARADAERLVELGYKHVHVTRIEKEQVLTYEPAPHVEGEILDPWRAAAARKESRRKRGLTQNQEAKRLGISLKELQELEYEG